MYLLGILKPGFKLFLISNNHSSWLWVNLSLAWGLHKLLGDTTCSRDLYNPLAVYKAIILLFWA